MHKGLFCAQSAVQDPANRLARWPGAWVREAWVPIRFCHCLAAESAGKGAQGKCLENFSCDVSCSLLLGRALGSTADCLRRE